MPRERTKDVASYYSFMQRVAEEQWDELAGEDFDDFHRHFNDAWNPPDPSRVRETIFVLARGHAKPQPKCSWRKTGAWLRWVPKAKPRMRDYYDEVKNGIDVVIPAALRFVYWRDKDVVANDALDVVEKLEEFRESFKERNERENVRVLAGDFPERSPVFRGWSSEAVPRGPCATIRQSRLPLYARTKNTEWRQFANRRPCTLREGWKNLACTARIERPQRPTRLWPMRRLVHKFFVACRLSRRHPLEIPHGPPGLRSRTISAHPRTPAGWQFRTTIGIAERTRLPQRKWQVHEPPRIRTCR
ncbi:hypothetical protein AAVH_42421, partial [Aphelenchoides avenae]